MRMCLACGAAVSVVDYSTHVYGHQVDAQSAMLQQRIEHFLAAACAAHRLDGAQ